MVRDFTSLGPFPAVFRAAGEPAAVAASGGTVVLLHGLGGEKEDLLEDLDLLGAAGLLAVAVDAVGHGQRRTVEMEELILGSEEEEERVFYQVVEETAHEIPALLDALAERGWLPHGQAAIVGVSMGGYIALAARAHEPRLAPVVCVSGSPHWTRHRERAPEMHLDAFWPAPLLVIHGEQDEVVDPRPGADFVQALRARYQDDPERLRRVTYPQAGHLFPADTWREVMALVRRFLERYAKLI